MIKSVIDNIIKSILPKDKILSGIDKFLFKTFNDQTIVYNSFMGKKWYNKIMIDLHGMQSPMTFAENFMYMYDTSQKNLNKNGAGDQYLLEDIMGNVSILSPFQNTYEITFIAFEPKKELFIWND